MNDPTKASRSSREGSGSRAGFDFKKFGIGLLVVLFLIIVFQNVQETRVDLLFFSTTMPLIIVLLISALVGLVAGYGIAAWGRRSSRD